MPRRVVLFSFFSRCFFFPSAIFNFVFALFYFRFFRKVFFVSAVLSTFQAGQKLSQLRFSVVFSDFFLPRDAMLAR